jgi:hypothetical protein
MIKHYSISKEDQSRLANVAEKIYLKRAELINELISWESLTTKWMWFDLPDTELDRIAWIDIRPTWMRAINNEFRQRKYPVRLYNVFGHGVELKEQGAMSNKAVFSGAKKITNVFGNVLDNAEGVIESDPEGKRVLQNMSMGLRRTMIYWHGEIQLSTLPGGVKSDLIKMIKENLPPELEQLKIV